jgi:hypothetical protein
VIYWKNEISFYAACHFRHALFSVVQRYIISYKVGACSGSLSCTVHLGYVWYVEWLFLGITFVKNGRSGMD